MVYSSNFLTRSVLEDKIYHGNFRKHVALMSVENKEKHWNQTSVLGAPMCSVL